MRISSALFSPTTVKHCIASLMICQVFLLKRALDRPVVPMFGTPEMILDITANFAEDIA
jgi:hypothetical protein